METWFNAIPTPFLLALFAIAGYAFGRGFRLRRSEGGEAKRELKRARAVIRELEGISQQVRRNLATHHTDIAGFKQRVDELSRKKDGEPWRELSEEAERMLKPTLRLSTQIAHAYDEIRQQTNLLMTFTEVRTDPLTGLRNRRALDEALALHFGMSTRYGSTVSLAIFDIDHFKRINDDQGHLQGDHVLQQLARLLDDSVRDTDVAARFGGEEFVVLMPETDLAGACVFSERMRQQIEEQMSVTVSGGIAQFVKGDTPESLIARADSALYCAKSAGRNFVFQHKGSEIAPIGDREPDNAWRRLSIAQCSDAKVAKTGARDDFGRHSTRNQDDREGGRQSASNPLRNPSDAKPNSAPPTDGVKTGQPGRMPPAPPLAAGDEIVTESPAHNA